MKKRIKYDGKSFEERIGKNEIKAWDAYNDDIEKATKETIAKYAKRGKVKVETFETVLENATAIVIASCITVMELYGYPEEEIDEYIRATLFAEDDD